MELDFKTYFEALKGYNNLGKTTLYHFSREDQPTLLIDPAKFGSNTFTKNDRRRATTKRSFFYVNLAHKEQYFLTYNLYVVQFPTDKIYDLMADTEGFLEQAREENGGVIDYDLVFQKISNAGYQGVYYGTDMEVVTLLVPVVGHRVDTSSKVA